MTPSLAFLTPGPPEMVIILIIAVLLFGKRLPEVARSLGRSMVEFKKGMRTIESEIHSATADTGVEGSTGEPAAEREDREEATAPKFEPPPAEPKPEPAEAPAEPAARGDS
jgi:sec-independent protein translocase protein TatA